MIAARHAAAPVAREHGAAQCRRDVLAGTRADVGASGACPGAGLDLGAARRPRGRRPRPDGSLRSRRKRRSPMHRPHERHASTAIPMPSGAPWERSTPGWASARPLGLRWCSSECHPGSRQARLRRGTRLEHASATKPVKREGATLGKTSRRHALLKPHAARRTAARANDASLTLSGIRPLARTMAVGFAPTGQ